MIFQILMLLVLALDVLAIIIVARSGAPLLNKVLWSLGILFFPLIGLAAYWVIEMKMQALTPQSVKEAAGLGAE